MDIDDTIEIASRYNTWEIVLLLVALVVIIMTGINFLQKVYGFMEDWRRKKNKEEDKDDDMAKRVAALEQSDVVMGGKLDTISAGVQQLAASMTIMSESLNKRLDDMAVENRKTSVAQARSILYQLASEFEKKDHISTAEYETFTNLSEIYIKNGGNSVFKNKIIPTIEAKPIRD